MREGFWLGLHPYFNSSSCISDSVGATESLAGLRPPDSAAKDVLFCGFCKKTAPYFHFGAAAGAASEQKLVVGHVVPLAQLVAHFAKRGDLTEAVPLVQAAAGLVAAGDAGDEGVTTRRPTRCDEPL